MDKSLAIGIAIGLTGMAGFGRDANRIGQSLSELKKRSDQIGMAKTLAKDALQTERELNRLNGTSARLTQEGGRLVVKLAEQRRQLRDMGVDVDKLEKSYRKLGRAQTALSLQQRGERLSGAGRQMRDEAKSQFAEAAASAAVLIKPVMDASRLDAQTKDIAITAQLSREAEAKLTRGVRDTALATNQDTTAITAGLAALVQKGEDIADSKGNLKAGAIKKAGTIGYSATAAGADTTDMAGLMYESKAKFGIESEADLYRAQNILFRQGQKGGYELKALAKDIPELGTLASSAGLKGIEGLTKFGAMMQTLRKGAGTDEQAKTLFNNFMAAPVEETSKNFAKLGFMYKESLAAFTASGMDEMTARFEVARKAVMEAKPEVGAEMQSISKIADQNQRTEALDQLDKKFNIATLFGDMQRVQALLAYMQNRDTYQEMTAVKDDKKDYLKEAFDRRMEGSAQQYKKFGLAMTELSLVVGERLAPFAGAAADKLSGLATWLGDMSQKAPGVTSALVGTAAALLALPVALAAGKFMLGGLASVAGGMSTVAGKVWGLGTGKLLGKGGKGVAGKAAGILGTAGDAIAGAAVQKVFVVNMPGGGLGGDLPGGLDGAGKSGGKGLAKGGRLARVGGFLKGAAGFAARHAGTALAVGTAAYQVYDTAKNAKTAEEKGRGYGGAAGSLAGGLAGAKLGAMIGAFGGPVGLAIGGLLGGAIGAFGGEKIGSWIGTKLAGSSKPDAGPKPPVPPATSVPAKPAAPAPVPASFTFAPQISLVVKGDVKDPKQVVAELSREIRTLFDQWQAQTARRAMYDAPHA